MNSVCNMKARMVTKMIPSIKGVAPKLILLIKGVVSKVILSIKGSSKFLVPKMIHSIKGSARLLPSTRQAPALHQDLFPQQPRKLYPMIRLTDGLCKGGPDRRSPKTAKSKCHMVSNHAQVSTRSAHQGGAGNSLPSTAARPREPD